MIVFASHSEGWAIFRNNKKRKTNTNKELIFNVEQNQKLQLFHVSFRYFIQIQFSFNNVTFSFIHTCLRQVHSKLFGFASLKVPLTLFSRS